MDKSSLMKIVTHWRDDFKKGQQWWSVAHHGALFSSIACSIGAGAVLELGKDHQTGFAMVLTSLAAALTGIAASGGFARKWRSNRLSRSRLDILLIDIQIDSADIGSLTGRLKGILSAHDIEIVGDKGSPEDLIAT